VQAREPWAAGAGSFDGETGGQGGRGAVCKRGIYGQQSGCTCHLCLHPAGLHGEFPVPLPAGLPRVRLHRCKSQPAETSKLI
jgi:hypothetical protein